VQRSPRIAQPGLAAVRIYAADRRTDPKSALALSRVATATRGYFTCNPSGGLCERVCGNDQDCLGYQPPRTCDLPTGLCKPIPQTCSVSTDCPSMQPRCDPTSLVCTGCVSSADCAGRSDGLLQCGIGRRLRRPPVRALKRSPEVSPGRGERELRTDFRPKRNLRCNGDRVVPRT
jgi:hypothetical protein